MVRNFRRNFQIIEFLLRDLSRVRTHDEMHLVRRAIDLLKQALQIDRSACTSRGDHEFHVCLSVISSEAEAKSRNQLISAKPPSFEVARPFSLRRPKWQVGTQIVLQGTKWLALRFFFNEAFDSMRKHTLTGNIKVHRAFPSKFSETGATFWCICHPDTGDFRDSGIRCSTCTMDKTSLTQQLHSVALNGGWMRQRNA